LLNTATGLEHPRVVIHEQRRLSVAPSCPSLQPRKHLRRGTNEGIAIHHIEGVLEVNLEQTHARRLVLGENITKRMGHHLDTSATSHTKVLAFEHGSDLILASKTETLGNQPSERITAAQRTNCSGILLQGNRHTTSEERLKEHWGLSSREHVDRAAQSGNKGKGLSPRTLLQEGRAVTKEPGSRRRSKGTQSLSHPIISEDRGIMHRARGATHIGRCLRVKSLECGKGGISLGSNGRRDKQLQGLANIPQT
jgi:hypothetical protein